MQHLIAQYLFNNKQCVLPNIGTLTIENEPATIIIGEQSIAAPKAHIGFSTTINTGYNDLVAFITQQKNVDTATATTALNTFCDNITSLSNNESFSIDGVGTFTAVYKEISFTPITTPAFFNATVFAERVIHPNDTHDMVVGDNNTDTIAMTELLAETPVKTYKWWVAAIILAVLSIAAIILYFNNSSNNTILGNGNAIEATAATPTYILP